MLPVLLRIALRNVSLAIGLHWSPPRHQSNKDDIADDQCRPNEIVGVEAKPLFPGSADESIPLSRFFRRTPSLPNTGRASTVMNCTSYADCLRDASSFRYLDF
jgi:hypothetical protein